MGRNAQPCKQPDLQDDKAPGDTLEVVIVWAVAFESTTVLRDTNGSVEEHLRVKVELFSKLLQPTATSETLCQDTSDIKILRRHGV